MDQIDQVRAFNRMYLRELGLLDKSYLGSGMGVTEVRLLYDIAAHPGQTARALGRGLGLDEGYVSRALAAFRRRGWLDRQPVPRDGRQFALALTPAGMAALAPLQARSRAQVDTRLAALPAPSRDRLVAAMAEIGRLLAAPLPLGPGSATDCDASAMPAPEASPSTADSVTLRDLAPGDAGWIIARHGALYAAEAGFDASFEALVAEILAAFLRHHDPARERGWVADRAGTPLGSIFCVRQDDATARLRLFLLELQARGLGLGRRMLETCIAFARASGYRRLVLGTHESHSAACALYRARGFVLTSSQPVRSFGVDLVEQHYALDLAA